MPKQENNEEGSDNLTIDAFSEQLGRATSVTVENKDEEWILWEFYATPTSFDHWGYDLLGETFLESQESQDVVVLQPDGEDQCLFDVLAVFADSNNLGESKREQLDDFNICNNSVITYSALNSSLSSSSIALERQHLQQSKSNFDAGLGTNKASRRRNRGRKSNGCNASGGGWLKICLPWGKS